MTAFVLKQLLPLRRRSVQQGALFLHASHVRPVRHVPGIEVLLHAGRQALVLAGTEARAGTRYAVGEAVLVDFGDEVPCVGDSGLLGDGILDALEGVGAAAGGG